MSLVLLMIIKVTEYIRKKKCDIYLDGGFDLLTDLPDQFCFISKK